MLALKALCLLVLLSGCLNLAESKEKKKKTMTDKRQHSLDSDPREVSPSTIDEAIRKASGGKDAKRIIHDEKEKPMIVDGMDMVVSPEQYERLYGHHPSHHHDHHHHDHEYTKESTETTTTTTTSPHPPNSAAST
ncbi:hypothetical protein ACOMHN_014629 [Nucella lapillus]